MKRFLIPILLLFAFPLSAEVRGGLRGGVRAGSDTVAAGTIELDARFGKWSIAPAYEVIRGGYGLHAVHVDVRRLFPSEQRTFWIGVGPTFVSSEAPSSETTWNVDAGLEWRTNTAWKPLVAVRFYRYNMPAFRDVIKSNGPVIAIGVTRRLFK